MPARKVSEHDFGALIRSLGGDYKKFADARYCPYCKKLLYKVDELPYDGQGVINGFAFPIEVKAADLSFDFADLKPHQRAGLSEWQKRHHRPAWLGLQMGTDPVNGKGAYPRRLWLIEWDAWLSFEEDVIAQGAKSLPYSPASTNRHAFIDNHLTATEMLKDYELVRIVGGWHLSYAHLFRVHYGLPSDKEDTRAEQPRLALD